MPFRVVYSGLWRQRVERLLIEAKAVGVVAEVRDAFAQLHEIMETDPLGLGESLYRLKYVGLMVYVVVRRFVSVRFAVDEDQGIVYLMGFAFSGNHPYPPEFEQILNPKKP